MSELSNRTLARGLDMLELLSENPQGLELHQIARLMELPKSTAYNLARTLTACKYAYKQDDGKYLLGLKMFEVGSAAVNDLDITAVIRQYMRQVYNECNETMHCGMMTGREVVYIDKLESTRSVRMSSRIGVRMPLHATAMGKALLASLTDAEIESLYSGVTLEKLTDKTITSLSDLLTEMGRVREAGFAVERGENCEGVTCQAVAIIARDGKPQYALSISAPSFRLTEEEETANAALLLRAKRKIERFLKAT
ncbi:MAG: IclR family transcriptional regulator [Eubacteriales bacterium]|nr:IclR family transcriptional regulator [Eubacteriales bacterium]MDD3883159.1 IclR family transcriptional regulator [Eubacteriales bacterium]MDD4512458.1 IclR family transcriptional regulator [Eubacteriales bacterium]